MFRKAAITAFIVSLIVLCYGFVAHDEIAMPLGAFMMIGVGMFTAITVADNETYRR